MGDADDGDKKPESLWEQVLAEHRKESSASKDRDDFRLFVLGSKGDGKEQLLSAVQGAEDLDESEGSDCYGLGFSYAEFKERPMGDDEDVKIRLLFTTIEKESMQGLLPAYFLRPGSQMRSKWIENAVFVITVDLSQPHDALRRLDTWYGHLEQLIAEITEQDPQLKEYMVRQIEKACDSFHTDPKTQTKKRANVDAELIQSAPADEPEAKETGPNMNVYKKMGHFERGNLGVPILVVGTKQEQLNRCAEASQKDVKAKENYMTFIQAALRKWCLQRGAALCYTSVEKQVNTKILREYLLYRLANIPMSSMLDSRRQVVQRTPKIVNANDGVFVPAYADKLTEIAKLSLGQYADMKYDVVVPPPQPRESAQEKAPPPEPFQEWLNEARKRAKDSGGATLVERPGRDRPSQATKALEHLRATERPSRRHGDPTAPGGDKSLEHTAEAFFSNMIKTYRKDGTKGPDAAGARPSRPARTSRQPTAGTEGGAAGK